MNCWGPIHNKWEDQDPNPESSCSPLYLIELQSLWNLTQILPTSSKEGEEPGSKSWFCWVKDVYSKLAPSPHSHSREWCDARTETQTSHSQLVLHSSQAHLMHTHYRLSPLEIVCNEECGWCTLQLIQSQTYPYLWRKWDSYLNAALRSLERRAICILLGKDKKAPLINLRRQVENMLVHSSEQKLDPSHQDHFCSKSTCGQEGKTVCFTASL